MQDELVLILLKLDLGIRHSYQDELLYQLIRTAKQNIAEEGVTLGETDADQSLVRNYAAWQYRQRANPENKMPRMIRADLNRKLVNQICRVDDDV